MIKKGDYIKCYLVSSALVEGNVEEYNDNLIKLSSKEDNSFILIFNPKRDIVFVKVCAPKVTYDNLSEQFQEELKVVPKNEQELDSKNMKLAQLKIMLNKKEKEILANKLKEHTVGQIKEVKYEQPRFTK